MWPIIRGKTVVLGVTGSIAAYRAAELVRALKKEGADVHVIMTQNACQFVTPLTMQVLSENPVRVNLFDLKTEEVGHITAARMADIVVIAPATANIMAKAAHGIADDYLSTVILASDSPVLYCPAMNPVMYQNKITQQNIRLLHEAGHFVLEPESGRVACGDEGKGRFPSIERIISEIAYILTPKTLSGRRVLVSAGPTREFFDPVRFISNPSSGKMGYAIASSARLRGAEVHLVSGPVSIEPPPGVNFYQAVSATDMYDIITGMVPNMDVIVMAAAVGDYRPEKVAPLKIKKKLSRIEINLVQNPDILASIGSMKRDNQVVVGFAAETNDILHNAEKKLKKKNLDFIVANDVTKPGCGFAYDTNQVKILMVNGKVEEIPRMTKYEVAEKIMDLIEDVLRIKSGRK